MPIPDSFQLPNLRKPGTFEPEHPRLPKAGRPPGRVNKITRDLKVGIIEAAAAHGGDGHGSGGLTGYLLHLATNHPKAFSALLAKLLPLQVSGSTVNSVVSAVRVLTVPVNHYLSADDIAKLRPALTLDAQNSSDDPELETETEEPAETVRVRR